MSRQPRGWAWGLYPNPKPPIPNTGTLGYRLGLRGHAGSGGDFGGEVAFLLLDAFAELEADEAGDVDRRSDLLGLGGDDVFDLGLVVHHEQLRQEGHLLAELGDRAVDHLLDDILGLARFLRLLGRDRALALDQGRIEILAA